MPEDPNDQQGGTPDGSSSETEQQNQSTQPGTGDGQGETPKIADPAATLAALEKANAEAAKFRHELAQAQAKIKTFEDEKLSETQRLQQRVQELEQQATQAETKARQVALRSEVTAAATKIGFINPGVAHRLIDDQAVEYDDQGRPKNLEAMLRALVKDEPYLARAGSADAGSGRRNSGNSGGGMNQLIRQAAGRGG